MARSATFRPSSRVEQAHYAALNRERNPYRNGREAGALHRANYGPNYDRLAAIKHSYDPGNLFHHNQNIAPVR